MNLMNEPAQKSKEQIAHESIAVLLEAANTALTKAATIADEAQISFSWGGPGYGFGGWYNPKKPEGWQSSNCWGEDDSGWQSSSSSC